MINPFTQCERFGPGWGQMDARSHIVNESGLRPCSKTPSRHVYEWAPKRGRITQCVQIGLQALIENPFTQWERFGLKMGPNENPFTQCERIRLRVRSKILSRNMNGLATRGRRLKIRSRNGVGSALKPLWGNPLTQCDRVGPELGPKRSPFLQWDRVGLEAWIQKTFTQCERIGP